MKWLLQSSSVNKGYYLPFKILARYKHNLPSFHIKLWVQKKKSVSFSVSIFISKTWHHDFTRRKAVSCVRECQPRLLYYILRINNLMQRWSPWILLSINCIYASRPEIKAFNIIGWKATLKRHQQIEQAIPVSIKSASSQEIASKNFLSVK